MLGTYDHHQMGIKQRKYNQQLALSKETSIQNSKEISNLL